MCDQNGSQVSLVCKYHQTGYCKFGDHCPKYHNNIICKERVCRDRNCNERHPKSCKYFSFDGTCRYPQCAYAHRKSNGQSKVDLLETEVKELKNEINELNNAMSEIMAKILTLEEITPRNQINTKNPTIEVNLDNQTFKCDQCEYWCKLEITLKKHINTKHYEKAVLPAAVKPPKSDLQCVLCDNIASTQKEFNEHVEGHLKEIRIMEPNHLLYESETFKCKVCNFKSRNKNAVKNHLLDHINDSLPDDAVDSDDNVIENKEPVRTVTKPYNIMDEFDNNGKPLYPSDTESETEDN